GDVHEPVRGQEFRAHRRRRTGRRPAGDDGGGGDRPGDRRSGRAAQHHDDHRPADLHHPCAGRGNRATLLGESRGAFMTQIHSHTALSLTTRLRRLRRSPAMRALVRETRLAPDMLVLPLFVCDGEGIRREVPSMPGVFNLSVDEAVKETEAARADGVNSVILFGIPGTKDDIGSLSYDPEAPVQTAVRAIKRAVPGVLVMTDVCLCEYTDHGHCGIIIDEEIANDPTVDQLVRAAVSHAAAGADIVAPSDMMDGRVGAIRA